MMPPSDAGDQLPVADRRDVVRILRAEMTGRWRWTLVIAGCLIGAAAAGLVPPLALGGVVDAVTDARGTSYLAGMAAAIVGATILDAVLAGAGLVASARLFDRLVARLRERLVERALRLPQSVVERAGSGDLLSRAGNDIASVSDALSWVLPNFSAALFVVAVTLIGLAALNPWLLLALTIAIPVQVVAVRYYLRTAPPIWAESMVVAGNRSNQVISSFRGAPTVTAFGLTDHHLDRIGQATWPVVRYGLLIRIVANRFFTRLTVSELTGLIGLLIVGRWLVVSDRASVGAATAGMLLVFRLFQPIRDTLLVLDTLQNGITALARVAGVIAAGERYPPAVDDDQQPTPAVGAIRLADVDYEYERGRPVLHNVDLDVAPHEHVALVGPSGAGKTTLAMLIAGVHQPTNGTIQIDGIDITRLSPHDLARRVAMISQSTHTFSGTLRDDLTLACPHATDTDVTAALATVHAGEWVEALPDGLDTLVGTDATHQLTPAQEQQLALARLVLKDPSIPILDEATAEAGSSGARTLERAALAATAGRTTLIVAHRLSQAAATDRVVVLDLGTISEQGAHDDLLASGGLYSRLWDAWASHRTA